MRLSVFAAFVLAQAARAEDWPTYMHDNARSGVTADSLDVPLTEQWVYRSPVAPQPAWTDPQPEGTEMPKSKFDDAFYTVAAGERVYFGSSVDNHVYSLDAATGQVRWKYATAAPVRLAPAIAGNRVYFGSDDGTVYGLNAVDGTSVWTYTAARDSRRVLGNGRVMSLWPVRTGVAVEGGRVYGGAGLFPHHGTFMFALDAASGGVVWKSDASRRASSGFSPQGYLLMCDRGIVVPMGRSHPVCVDRATGSLLYQVNWQNRGMGGTYGMVDGGNLFIGMQNMLGVVDTQTGAVAAKWPSARWVLATPDRYYVLKSAGRARTGAEVRFLNAPESYDGLKTPAYPPDWHWTSGASNEITAVTRSGDAVGWPSNAVSAASVRWRYGRPELASMILAGSRLVAGGSNEVVVLDAKSGQAVWTGRVSGLAVGLTVANGRLFVSTTEGAIHCFASGTPPRGAGVPPAMPPSDVPEAEGMAQSAKAILRASGVRAGHALVAGHQAVRLACELARHSDLRITCVESDPQRALLSRKLPDADRAWGVRVAVDVGTPSALPYPDYAANLVVYVDGPGQAPCVAKELLRVLKPCGGVLMVGALPGLAGGSRADAAAVRLWSKEGPVSQDITLLSGGATWTKLVRGVLDGSGWWTHCYADAGNTGSSGDRRVKGELDVLWFGEPGADVFPNTHQRNVPPLVMNGRVFCQGWRSAERRNVVLSFDAYNGVRYWEREIPGAVRLGLPTVAGNLACTADSLFVAAGSQCHRLDAVTGVTRAVYETPRSSDGTRPPWGYVAVADGVLFGSATTRTRFSDSLFAFELQSGRPMWVYRGKEIRDSAIAWGGGRLFFAENRGQPATPGSSAGAEAAPEPADDAAGPADPGATFDRLGKVVRKSPAPPLVRTVVALDEATGRPAWEQDVDLTGCGTWEALPPGNSGARGDFMGFGHLQALCTDDLLLFAGASHSLHDGRGADARRAVALDARDGRVVWAKPIGGYARPLIVRDALLAEPSFYDLRTGELIHRPDPKTGRTGPWSIVNTFHRCGSFSACDAMVFFRSGSTNWRNVSGGSDGSFAGMRPGCFINIIPAGGVVVQPEASSGCTCSHPIQCTVVLAPRRAD